MRRSSNRVVHSVAQKAARGLVFFTWEFMHPVCLLSSLQRVDVLFDVSFHFFGSIYKIEVLSIEKK